jgi:glycosyltransferase involved in cell wall biosynthesis
MKYAIITTCKGRLEHLKQSLPRFCAFPDAEVIVVDYACPEQSGQWVRQSHPSVKVVFAEDGGAFNACRARNLGAGQSTAEILIFADADTLIDPGAAAEIGAKLRPGTYGIVEVEDDDQLQDDLRGTCMVYRADFDRAGGYDEYLKGYAMEDIDLYDRLNCLDLKPVMIGLKWFGAIKHADDLRMKYRGGRKEISQLVSLLYRRYIGAVRRMQRKPQADAEVRALIYRQSEQLVMRLIEARDPSGGVQIGLTIPVAQQADAFGNDMIFEFQLQLKMRPRDAAGFSRRYQERKPRPPYLAR